MGNFQMMHACITAMFMFLDHDKDSKPTWAAGFWHYHPETTEISSIYGIISETIRNIMGHRRVAKSAAPNE